MMGQFIFGLFAGIVVGLVMEWVIDWTGLLPKGVMTKRTPQNQAKGAAVISAEVNKEVNREEQISEKATTPPSSNHNSTSGE